MTSAIGMLYGKIGKITQIKNVENGFVVAENTKNSLIYSQDKNQVVACIGLENMLVVSMRDAVLVANKNESQNVKKIVNMLKEKKYDQGVSQKKDFRPWGNFGLTNEEDFHVKI